MYCFLFLLLAASQIGQTNKDPAVKKSVLSEDRREIKEPEDKVQFSFREDDYILAPSGKAQALSELKKSKDGKSISLFLDNISKVDPKCLFPGKGYYTIFIPRDSAFNDFNKRILESYNEEELCKFFQQHIIREIITLRDIEEAVAYNTLAGNRVVLNLEGSRYTINDVYISSPFIFTKNGIIVHLIDGLLTPK